MLAIRLQRTGRKGHAQFRVIVQDGRFSPTSGRVVAYVGSYDPHTKVAKLDGEKIKTYLASGAQPSPRVISLLKADKIKLPEWVMELGQKQRAVRNPDKRRSTRPEAPAEEAAPAAEEPAAAESTEAVEAEAPAAETPAQEAPVEEGEEVVATPEEPVAETPDEEAPPAAAEPTPAEDTAVGDEPSEPIAEEPAESKD